ncbi:MAG: serine protease [Patescibacteria group bacterium]
MSKVFGLDSNIVIIACLVSGVVLWKLETLPQEPRVILESSVKIEVKSPAVESLPPSSPQAQPPEVPKEEQKKTGGFGSGTVIGHSHYHLFGDEGACNSVILTSEHVVNNATGVIVYWKGQEYDGRVFAKDAELDLALIYVSVCLPKAEMFFGPMVTGEPEWVVGYPFGRDVSISHGYVSSPTSKNVRQGSASVWFGNSGGGTFIFRHNHYVLAGVTNAIHGTPMMGGMLFADTVEFFVTMDKVRKFLTDNYVMN